MIEDTIEGLEFFVISARSLIDKVIVFGREGKTVYVADVLALVLQKNEGKMTW